MLSPCSLHFAPDRAPSRAEIARRFRPGWMFECEARGQEPTGNDAPALENQLALGAKNERSSLEQPSRRRQAEANSPRAAQGSHEFGIGQRIGSGDIDRAAQLFVIEDPVHGVDEVAVMNPRHKL